MQPGRTAPRSPQLVVPVVLSAALAVAGLTWAKWWPYAFKLQGLLHSRSWSGSSMLISDGSAGTAPSLRGGWDFTLDYGKAVWKALVVGLLLASAVDALVPRRWIVGVLSRPRRSGGSLAGGLLSIPCMMCTCCAAPLSASLRRTGAPTSSVLAYWVGNPTLNPAVLAFLAVVAPWQWAVTRLLVGIVLVFGVTALVARLTRGRDAATDPSPATLRTETDAPPRSAPRRFALTLGRLSVTLLPEYAVVVFAIGVFHGWLFPLGDNASHWGLLAVVFAVIGTLVVIPTAGEIPVLQGLAAAGAGAGVLGTLLITLPAISLPSMIMVMRDLSWRATLAMAGGVAAAGLAAGALLWAIT
jgi:uncharacterized membrane protein YraQ (UPF0718 family)